MMIQEDICITIAMGTYYIRSMTVALIYTKKGLIEPAGDMNPKVADDQASSPLFLDTPAVRPVSACILLPRSQISTTDQHVLFEYVKRRKVFFVEKRAMAEEKMIMDLNFPFITVSRLYLTQWQQSGS
jgi:hypothetical protein